MKRSFAFNTVLLRIWTVVIALALSISVFGQIPRRSPPTTTNASAGSPMPLKVAAGVVQKTLAEYQVNAKSPLKLDSAEFDFKVQTEGSGGLGFGIPLIFTIGASRTEDHVTDVTVTYSVPKPSPSSGASSPSPGPQGAERPFTMLNFSALDIKTLADTNINAFANTLASGTTTPQVKVDKFHDDLLKAITNAAQSVKDVPSIGGARFEKFAVTIEYSVKWEGNAAGNIPIFSFLTVAPKLGASLNSVHSIKLVFPKEPDKSE